MKTNKHDIKTNKHRWSEDITKVRKFEDLPANCQAYVKRIEKEVGVPINWIGVGPAREDTIVKN